MPEPALPQPVLQWSIETQFDTHDTERAVYAAKEIQPLLEQVAEKLDLCGTGATIVIKVTGNKRIGRE